MALIKYSPSHFNDLNVVTENAECKCAGFYDQCCVCLLLSWVVKLLRNKKVKAKRSCINDHEVKKNQICIWQFIFFP